MRIAFYGNIANNFYQIVKALRAQYQIDAHLYIDAHGPTGMRPESDSPTLKNHYPNWIHEGHYLNRTSMLFPWTSHLVRELEQYDAVIVSYLGPMFTQFIHKPTIFFVTGSDLTFFPFPREYRLLHAGTRSKLSALVKGFWLRRGIRRVLEIWTQPYFPFVNALNRLHIDEARISPIYLPLVIDTDRFTFDENARYHKDQNIQHIIANFDFVVFHPSRLMIQDHPQLKTAGQWKRNDLLFRGFAKFIERSGARRSVLVMPDRTQSDDLPMGKEIIHKMGLDQNVLWIKPPRQEGFTRDELIPIYSIADVVADDFGIGWFGSVVLEAYALSRPVVTYVDENVVSKLYPWHPILSANTEEGIADHLMRLYTDPEYKKEVGCKGREWIEEFHSGKKVSAIYVKKIMELCDRFASGR
jgi:glycosyltransferase involved in cell wall biosynthesis